MLDLQLGLPAPSPTRYFGVYLKRLPRIESVPSSFNYFITREWWFALRVHAETGLVA